MKKLIEYIEYNLKCAKEWGGRPQDYQVCGQHAYGAVEFYLHHVNKSKEAEKQLLDKWNNYYRELFHF